jgi:hypothetical protein
MLSRWSAMAVINEAEYTSAVEREREWGDDRALARRAGRYKGGSWCQDQVRERIQFSGVRSGTCRLWQQGLPGRSLWVELPCERLVVVSEKLAEYQYHRYRKPLPWNKLA